MGKKPILRKGNKMNSLSAKALLTILLLISSNLFALNSTNTISKERADQIAADYLKMSYNHPAKNFELKTELNPICPPYPDQTSCLKVICDKTGDCAFDSSVREIAQACRGVSGDCLEVLCAKTNDCVFKSSAIALAESCRASNGMCTRIGCEKTGDCVFSSNAKEIAQACSGVYDGNCVSYACDRTGSCSQRSSFIALARSCAGY